MTNKEVIVKVGIWELLYTIHNGVPIYNRFFSRLDNVGPVPRTLGHFSAQDHAGDTAHDGQWVDTVYIPVGGGLYKKVEVSIDPVEMTGFVHECGQWIPADVSAAASTLGSIKTDKKANSSRENGKLGGRPKNWAVVVAYEYPGHEKGEVISIHATPEAAKKAAKKSGRDSFLTIKHVNDL